MNPDDFLMLHRWKTSLSFIFIPLSLSSFQVACWSSCLASLLPVASWWPLARRRRTRCGTRTSLEIPVEMCGKKHRKTIGKPQEKWREPLSVGNPRSHPHGVVIPLLIHIFESPIFGKPYIKFPVFIWCNPFQSQTVWWAKSHASIHLLGSIRIFVGAGYLTCWSQNPVFRIGYMMILIVWLMM